MCFVNFSNHNSENWSQKQVKASEKWGKIVNIAFPHISPNADEAEIQQLAQKYICEIVKYNPTAVMCQGEFTLSYAVINGLKERGITVVSACSERRAVEEVQDDGSVRKYSVFEFVQFRRY